MMFSKSSLASNVFSEYYNCMSYFIKLNSSCIYLLNRYLLGRFMKNFLMVCALMNATGLFSYKLKSSNRYRHNYVWVLLLIYVKYYFRCVWIVQINRCLKPISDICGQCYWVFHEHAVVCNKQFLFYYKTTNCV